MKYLALLLLACGLGAQSPWPAGMRGAVSLTYDDGLASQVQHAAPALKKAGLRASFFPTGKNSHAAYNHGPWGRLVPDGHELGSHTMEHPCAKATGFTRPGFALEDYDLKRMRGELGESVQFLRKLGEPRKELSFAYPCGMDWVGESRQGYGPLVRRQFAFSRGVLGMLADPARVDLGMVPAYDGAAPYPGGLAGLAQKARAEGRWLVICFHGVGGDYLSVALDEHQRLLDFLSKNKSSVWTAPFGEVAARVRAYQRAKR